MGDDGRWVGPPVPLESWWVPAGVLAATVLLVSALILARRRGRLHHRFPVVLSAVAGVLVCGLFAANSYAGYLPSFMAVPALLGHPDAVHVRGDGDLPSGRGSVVAAVTLSAPDLRVPAQTTYLYLPPGYRTGRLRYSTLYLYGGWPGRSTDWLVAGRIVGVLDALISQRRMVPMIVVMPDTTLGGLHDTECLDAVSGPRLETFLSERLVRYVDRHFRTLPERTGRAVGGMSSGGFCALNIGLHHTARYGAIAALEPYLSAGSGPESSALAGRHELIDRNTVSTYLPTLRFAGPTPVFLDWPDRASADELADNRWLAAQLGARGQRVTTLSEQSWHTWHQAQLGAPAMLEFLSRNLAPPRPAP